MNLRVGAAGLLVLTVMMSQVAESAAKWSFDPSAKAGIIYNDNIRLVTREHDAVWGREITPRLGIEVKSPQSLTKIGAQLRYINYTKNEVKNANQQRFTILSRYQQTPRSRWDLTGNLLRDTVLTPISAGTGFPGAIPDPDEGADNDARRNRLRLTPSWTRTLTPRDFLTLSYALYDITYVGDTGINTLIDNRSHGGAVTYRRAVTKKTDLSIVGGYAEYNAPDVNTTTQNVSMIGRIEHDFSGTLTGMVELGLRSTDTESGGVKDQSSNPVYKLIFTQQLHNVTSYKVTAQRRLAPSGTGNVLDTDRIDLQFRHKIKPTLAFSLLGRYFKNGTIGAGSTTPSRRERWYYLLRANLIKNLTPHWKIDGAYAYRRQKLKTDNRSADSNSVYANVTYTW